MKKFDLSWDSNPQAFWRNCQTSTRDGEKCFFPQRINLLNSETLNYYSYHCLWKSFFRAIKPCITQPSRHFRLWSLIRNCSNCSNCSNFSNCSNNSNCNNLSNLSNLSNLCNFSNFSNFSNSSNFINFSTVSNFSNFSNFGGCSNFSNLSNFSNFST